MNTGAVVLLCLSGRHDQYCRQAAFNCLLSTLFIPLTPKSAQTRGFIPFFILRLAFVCMQRVSTPSYQLGMKMWLRSEITKV